MSVHKLQERSARKKQWCFKTPTACQTGSESSAIISSYSYICHWLPSSTSLPLPTLSIDFPLSYLGCYQTFFFSSSLVQPCSQSCTTLFFLTVTHPSPSPHQSSFDSWHHTKSCLLRMLRSSCFLRPSNLIVDSFTSVCFLLQHSETQFCFSVTPSAYISEYFPHTLTCYRFP